MHTLRAGLFKPQPFLTVVGAGIGACGRDGRVNAGPREPLRLAEKLAADIFIYTRASVYIQYIINVYSVYRHLAKYTSSLSVLFSLRFLSSNIYWTVVSSICCTF